MTMSLTCQGRKQTATIFLFVIPTFSTTQTTLGPSSLTQKVTVPFKVALQSTGANRCCKSTSRTSTVESTCQDKQSRQCDNKNVMYVTPWLASVMDTCIRCDARPRSFFAPARNLHALQCLWCCCNCCSGTKRCKQERNPFRLATTNFGLNLFGDPWFWSAAATPFGNDHWQTPCCTSVSLPSSLVSRSCHKPVLFRTRFPILCHQRFNWNKNLNQPKNLTWKNPLSFISVAFEGDRVRACASSLNTQVSSPPASSPASFSSSSLAGRNRDVVGALVLLPLPLLQHCHLCHQPIYFLLLRL